ncbi:hypothetical protein UlMin_006251 [Ulmus minor]
MMGLMRVLLTFFSFYFLFNIFVAFDPNGDGPYTGVGNSRIVKFNGGDRSWSDFAFNSSQRKPEISTLLMPILDMAVVGPDGGLATRLVSEVEGKPLKFTNDMDIDEDEDVIYFTDSSTDYYRRQYMASMLSGDKTGRLLKYNITSKEVTVLVRGIGFANGVALSKDRSFVLVVETSACKILRLWLKGPKAGSVDVFAELPGFPDNIRRNSKEEFRVALHAKTGLVSFVYSNSFGKILLKLNLSPKQLFVVLEGGKVHATAIKLSEEGKILDVLEDSTGKSLMFVSQVLEKDGKLWFGSVQMPFLGIYNLH